MRLPAAVVGIVVLGGLYWQVLGGIRAVAQSSGDPSTASTFYRPLTDWLGSHGGHRTRVEVPPTSNHWEAAYVAPGFDLARGWLRQLDSTRDEIFYDRALSSPGYYDWLKRNAVRFVALPNAPIDYSARTERALILSRPGYLRPRWNSAYWQVFEVRRARPIVVAQGSGQARLLHLGTQSLLIDVIKPGTFDLRVHYTHLWSVNEGAGCVQQAGEWTRLRVPRPAQVRVSISLSPRRLVKQVADRPSSGEPGARSCLSSG